MAPVSTAEPDGQAIRKRREMLGLTRAELARLIRRHPQTITDVECERRTVSLLLVGQIARALKTDPESFIKGEAA